MDPVLAVIVVLTVAGGMLGFVGAWLGWPVFMCAQCAMFGYGWYAGDWWLAVGAVVLATVYTFGWLLLISARITRNGVEVKGEL